LKRAAIIILDGVGIGEAPDAAKYGDSGSDTLGNVARACGGLTLPRLERFGFDVEVLFIARKLGYSTIEVPVRWNDMAGTKVGAVSGLAAFLDPLRVRLHQLRGKYR